MEEEPYESDNSTEFLAEDLHVDVEPSEAGTSVSKIRDRSESDRDGNATTIRFWVTVPRS